jgi:tetratricopeptide (TPR) repeat protein
MNRKLTTAFSLSLAALALLATATPSRADHSASARLNFSASAYGRDSEEEYNRGVDLFNKRQYKEAIAAFSKAISLKATFTDAYFNRGVAYRLSEQYDKAAADMTVVITKKPKLADAYLERGQAYSALKQNDKALEDFNQALVLKPGLVEVYPARAGMYYLAGDYDKAIADYSQYLSSGTKADPNIYNNRGLAYLNKYNKDKNLATAQAALADFDKYIATAPDASDGILSRADAYYALKQYDKAVGDYTLYINTHPKDVYAYQARALSYLETKKYQQAISDYTTLKTLAPGDPKISQNLGFAYQKMGDNASAVKAFSGAISTPPKASEKPVLTSRAQAYMSLKDYPNAITDYTALISLDKSDPTTYYNRGVAYTSTNNPEKAIPDFNTFLTMNPKDPSPAYNGLGLLYLKQKDFPKAAESYTKYIAVKPDDAQARYNRAVAIYNINQGAQTPNKQQVALGIADLEAYTAKQPDPEATKLLSNFRLLSAGTPAEKVVALASAEKADPKNPDNPFNMGVIYLNDLKDNDKAIAALTRAIALDAKDPQIVYTRAIAYANKKDYANAAKDATAALALKPGYSDALITRADARLNNKEYPGAIADYRAYVATGPKDAGYALQNMTVAALNAKDYNAAVESANLLIKLEPANPEGLRRRGDAYLLMTPAKYEEGITDLSAYLAKKPGETQALLNRGVAYTKKPSPEFDKAAADFDAAFAAKPSFSAGQQSGLAYTELGKKFKDDPKAAGYFAKAAEMFDKAIAAKTATDKQDEVADAYYNKSYALQLQAKEADSVEPLKPAVAALRQYLVLKPAASDAAAVKQLITQLEAKIAEG